MPMFQIEVPEACILCRYPKLVSRQVDPGLAGISMSWEIPSKTPEVTVLFSDLESSQAAHLGSNACQTKIHL